MLQHAQGYERVSSSAGFKHPPNQLETQAGTRSRHPPGQDGNVPRKDAPWAFLELADGDRVSLFAPVLPRAAPLVIGQRVRESEENKNHAWTANTRSRL